MSFVVLFIKLLAHFCIKIVTNLFDYVWYCMRI